MKDGIGPVNAAAQRVDITDIPFDELDAELFERGSA